MDVGNGAEPSHLQATESEEDRRFVAKYVLHPIQHAARAVGRMSLGDDKSRLEELCNELGEQAAALKKGDSKRAVTMLAAQGHTLEALFYCLLEKASDQICYPSEMLLYLKPALKAQSQCRATFETLASLTSPRPLAVVQNNVAENMQVNNNVSLPDGQMQNAPNKLLEEAHAERMGEGTTGATGRGDSAVEALGAVHGTKDDRG
jgi:hypothetical protein